MRKWIFAALAVLTAVFAGTAQASLNGQWDNENPGTGNLVRVDINGAQIRAYGACSPTPCDWGAAGGAGAGSGGLYAIYNQGFAIRLVMITPINANRIRVQVSSLYTDSRAPNVVSETFRRALPPPPPPAAAEDCLNRNPAAMTILPAGGRWKLAQGSEWISDFPNPAEAALALLVVQSYGLNRQCFVGRPNPGLEYWLIGGNAPSGGIPGEDCLNFNPAQLQVTGGGSNWILGTPGRSMFSFRTQADALQARAIIQGKGFTKSCFVGRPNPGMRYLRR